MISKGQCKQLQVNSSSYTVPPLPLPSNTCRCNSCGQGELSITGTCHYQTFQSSLIIGLRLLTQVGVGWQEVQNLGHPHHLMQRKKMDHKSRLHTQILHVIQLALG